MSWDVFLMKLPEGFDDSLEDLPDDFEEEDICTYEYLIDEIKNLFPHNSAEFDDDSRCLVLIEKTYSIEFDFGKSDPINHISLSIRGDNDALKPIELFCERFNCSAVDSDTGEIIKFSDNSNKGFSKWQEYENRVVDEYNK
jgi:hypothetical protein